MNTHHTHGNIKAIINEMRIITAINLLITFCLNIVWILVCMRECYRFVNRYLTCKRTSDLHPIYKDVQYLSRQRKLYNLETHIVKYVLAISCLSVEVVGIVNGTILSSVEKSTRMNTSIIRYESQYPNCYLNAQAWKLYSTPSMMWFQNINQFTFLLWFVLISILTRYLAARYLSHPFNKTLYRYIVWISVQFCIVAFFSYKYTFLFSIFAFPLLFLINWLVLLRDNRILCRVLKSNLTELDLHSNNRVLYHEQVSGYRCYRFFIKVLLSSSLFFVVGSILKALFQLIDLLTNSFCLLNIIYSFNHTVSTHIPFSSPQIALITDIISDTCVFIYSISISLPIICITLIPLIRACVKRYKSRYMVYRYNYENIQPLLRR